MPDVNWRRRLQRLPADHLLCYSVVRMIWWFLILGVSTLVVVCVAIALYMRLRHYLQEAHAARGESSSEVERERRAGEIEH
jgi:uncharacterized membrane protein